jgi:TolB-like protein
MTGQISDLSAAFTGHYVLRRELGRGGMAIVYLADDLRHGRTVALKVLHPDLGTSLGPERFLREIRVTAQLQHPRILTILDSGDVNGQLWYTMPYVAGETLRSRIVREKQLPIDDALSIARQVTEALGHAHDRGIVHRDIKPENILLREDQAIVADFGIARALAVADGEKLTQTGLSLGTPAYMSPEQAAGSQDVDARSDLYSLGCMMYEMLAGQPPFSAPTAQGLLARHAVDPVPSLRTVRSTVPPHVERAVEKALAKVPADRFRSAKEFAAALDQPGATVVVPSRPRAPTRRRAIAAAIIVAAGVASTTAIWRSSHKPGPVVVPSAALIAVLPFTPSVPDTGLERLGRDLVLTLSPTLDGVGDIRTVDAHTVLAHSTGSPDASPLEHDRTLGRKFGAGSVLRGSVLRVGRQVRLDVGLVASDSTSDGAIPLARASITGPPDSIEALTDDVIRALLPQIWHHGTAPSPSLDGVMKTKSIAALRSFLEGERALTESRWDDATEAYGRAIEADSSFWLAYSRYAYILQWRYRPVDSTITAALEQHRAQLPERERLALESPPGEKASDALERAKRITQRFPTNWFAWFEYADRLHHWAPLLGHTGSEARAAFEETLQLNPRLVPGWEHLLINVFDEHDTIASARVLDALTRLNPDSAMVKERGTNGLIQSRLIDRLERGDTTGAKALSDTIVRDVAASGGAEFETPAIYGFNAADLAMQRRLLRLWSGPDQASITRRFIAYDWAGRGAWDSALVTLDENVKLNAGTDSMAPLQSYTLAVIGAWLGALRPDAAVRPRQGARVAADALGPDAQAEAAWLDGILAAVRGDRRALKAAQTAAHAAALAAGDSSGVLERSLAGFDLYLSGATRQAGEALATLEWEQAEQFAPHRFPHRALMPVNRIAAAQWLFASGDTAQAARLLTWVEGDFGLGGLTALALRGLVELERARIEEARGHAEQALAHYRQFLLRYDAPMPSQRPLVAEAKEAVARLSGRGD